MELSPEVTGESFHEIVVNGTQDVFLMASASWCGACTSMRALWVALAEALQGTVKVRAGGCVKSS